MTAALIRVGPSQSTPWNGWAKVFAEIPVRYRPGLRPLTLNVPSPAVVADPTDFPEASLIVTFTPGSPSSPCSTRPGVPPPGLKSRQTTPLTAPGARFGRTACFAPEGTSPGGIPTRPMGATPPAGTGRARVSPRDAEPTSPGLEGRASESTPGGLTLSWTLPTAALTAPRPGSLKYMMCQITPAANSEMAMGMNTAVLNATDQRTRSVSTAKIRPIAVTSAGTTATQIALLRIAVWSVWLVKSSL